MTVKVFPSDALAAGVVVRGGKREAPEVAAQMAEIIDEQSFLQLYRRTATALRAYAARVLGTTTDAAAPIELGERVQVGIALVGAVALLICLWRDASRLATSSSSLLIGSDLGPLLSVAMTVSTLLLVAIAAVACRHLFVGERV